ncbi:MAG: MFS transporter, partial [Gammaproteobacteria bacterium]
MACSSCHDLKHAGQDGRAVAVGINGSEGSVNSPSVFNSGFGFRQFWDGRAATLEEQAAGPVHNPIEMGSNWEEVIAKLNQDHKLVAAFNSIWKDGITASNIQGAIAEFERSLITPNSPFDRYLKGDDTALTEKEKHGWRLFRDLGCVSCHQGVGIGNNMYANLGVMDDYFSNRGRPITKSDLGRFNVTGDEKDMHVFKVPGLRNVALTAPYFHDGSIATLDKVVYTMARYQLGVSLDKQQIDYLVAFLIYNDGIGIIIGIAVIYGAELGFETTELILALLLVQFVGIPFSLVFGNLPSKGDKRQSMYLAFVLFNIVLLPIVGLAGMKLLPHNITGTPSPDFAATATAVGQGKHTVAEAGAMDFQGAWQTTTVTGEMRGETCAWYAFWCDPAQYDVVYATTADPEARLDFAFNGQLLRLTISNGPDHGRWAVEMDGQPLLDDNGQPVIIDAYSPTIRYGVIEEFRAVQEGEHVFSLVNTGQADPASSGTVMSVAQIEVRPPLRTSNLGAIIGLILALQVIGFLFAYFLGPRFFAGLAEKFDTKRSIMLALFAYSIIAVWGYFLNAVIEFWFLAWMVAIVQGGSQALSRSLYASMSPAAKSGEFFGLYGIMEKFSAIIGPLLFAAARSDHLEQLIRPA